MMRGVSAATAALAFAASPASADTVHIDAYTTVDCTGDVAESLAADMTLVNCKVVNVATTHWDAWTCKADGKMQIDGYGSQEDCKAAKDSKNSVAYTPVCIPHVKGYMGAAAAGSHKYKCVSSSSSAVSSFSTFLSAALLPAAAFILV